MKKTVYIIPGFEEKASSKAYQKIANFFKARNFKAVPVKISWKYRTISDYIEEFLKQVKINEGNKLYLLGFSFGAMIAFIASTKIKTKMQILCSISPCFKEDLKHFKKSWKKLDGKKRIKDFKNFSYHNLAKKTNAKTLLIVGSKEHKIVLRRVNEIHKEIKNSELIIAKNAKHDISQKEYLNALKEMISTL